MDRSILDNRSVRRLLLVLVAYPRRFFSISELALRSGLNMGKIKTLVSLFLRKHLLNATEKNRQRYFQINRHAGLFDNLKKIFSSGPKTKRLDPLEKIIRSAGDVRLAALTGIFTGETYSQIDLLLVGKISQKRLERCIKILEKIVGREINYAIMSEQEYYERRYSFDWFLKEILERDPVIVINKLKKEKAAISPRYLRSVYSNIRTGL